MDKVPKIRARSSRLGHMLRTGITAAIIFVILYAFSLRKNSELNDSLAHYEEMTAIEMSMRGEAQYYKSYIYSYAKKCGAGIDKSCEELVQLLIERYNRLLDYEQELDGLRSEKSYRVLSLEVGSARQALNSYVHRCFGLTFSQAKRKGIKSAKEFADFSLANSLIDLDSILAIEAFSKGMEHHLGSARKIIANSNVEQLLEKEIEETRLYFAAVFLLELLVFVLINGADVIINNDQ